MTIFLDYALKMGPTTYVTFLGFLGSLCQLASVVVKPHMVTHSHPAAGMGERIRTEKVKKHIG